MLRYSFYKKQFSLGNVKIFNEARIMALNEGLPRNKSTP